MEEKENLEISEEHKDQEEELFEHYRFVADKGQEFLRIDKFLMDRVANTSRNKIQLAASNGNIRVNDKPVKSSYKVKPHDVISIVFPHPIREIELIPEEIPLEVVYEDDDVVVINKQAGIVVHPGYGNYSGTLINALIYHFQNLPSQEGAETRPGLVHRLDKLTTGLMVVAKTDHALNHLAKQFFDRTTSRTYNALVWGDVKEDEGRIEGNIGRSLKNRKVFQVFPEGNFGKHAVTNYKVLERFGYVTLIQCKLETGRTHQIRVHLKHIGHTLFGDLEYGGDKVLKGTTFTKYKQFINNCFKILPRQALHAKSLGFIHPETSKEILLETELPEDMAQVLKKWRNYTIQRNS